MYIYIYIYIHLLNIKFANAHGAIFKYKTRLISSECNP